MRHDQIMLDELLIRPPPAASVPRVPSQATPAGIALAEALRGAAGLDAVCANVHRFVVLSLEGDVVDGALSPADRIAWLATAAHALPDPWARLRRRLLGVAADIAEEDGQHERAATLRAEALPAAAPILGSDLGRVGGLLRRVTGL